MPHYRSGSDIDHVQAVQGALLELAQHGPFDANDAVFHLMQRGLSGNVGDAAAALEDLETSGQLLGEQDDEGPRRFRLP